MEHNIFEFSDEDMLPSSFTAFQSMRINGVFVDLTVVIGNRRFPVHRVVLAAGIPHMNEMFPASSNEFILTDIDPEIFEDFINFAYSGRIKIHDEKVCQLLRVSQIFRLTKVHTACLKFMAVRINMNNVLGYRSLAVNIQSSRLISTCDFYILRNFEAFVYSNEFLKLSFECLIEIISRDDLNVTSEERVFEAIIKWAKASPVERCDLFPELLSAVRLTHIAPDYLVDKISAEELVVSSLQCKNLVDVVKNYHLSKKAVLSCEILNTRLRTASGDVLYAICSSTLGCYIETYGKETLIPLSKMASKDFDHVVGFNGKLYFFKRCSTGIQTFDVKTLKTEFLETEFLKTEFLETEFLETEFLRTYESPYKSDNCFQQIIIHDSEFYAFTCSNIFCFNLVLKKWLMKTVMECNESGIASLGEYIYVTGGFINGNLVASCRKYNPSTGLKSKISPMLSGRSCHSCTGLNSRLYICHFDKAEMYNPFVDQWFHIASMAFSKRLISLSAYKGKLFALKEGLTEVYDPQHNAWTLGTSVPEPCNYIKFVTVPFI